MAQPAAGLYVELRALVEKFSQDMDSAVKVVTGAQKKIQNAMGTVQKVVGAAAFLGGVVAIKKLGDAVTELAARGDRVGDVRDNFEKLGGSFDGLQDAKDAILGVVTATDLMQIANEGLIKQIPGYAENFGKIAELGNQVADALGMDVKEGITQVTEALASGKVKQLEAIGVMVDQNQAYKEYAAQIGVATDKLSKQQEKEALQIAAMGQLTNASKRYAEVGDSVAAASDAVTRSMDEALDSIGEAINNNDELREAYRRLEETLDNIDWGAVGEDIAELAAIIIDKLGYAINWATEQFDGFVRGLKVLDRAMLSWRGGQAGLLDSIANAQKDVAKAEEVENFNNAGKKIITTIEGIDQALGKAKSLKELEKIGEKMKDTGAEIAKLGDPKMLTAMLSQTGEHFNELAAILPETTKIVIKHGEKSGEALEGEAKAAKKAADEVAKLRTQWDQALAKMTQEGKENALEAQIKEAIETLDSAKLDGLVNQLRETVEQGFVQEWKEAIDSGAVSLEEVTEQAKVESKKIADTVYEDMSEAGKKAAEDTAKEFASAFDDIASVLGDALGEISPELEGLFSGLSDMLSEETKAGLTQGIADALGTDAAGLSNYAAAAGTVITSVAGAQDKDKATKSNEGTGEAVGATAGAVIGGVVGSVIPVIGTALGAMAGAVIGKFIGGFAGGMLKWGSQNPETQARHAFANFVEEGFEKLKQVSFYNSNGELTNYRGDLLNFVEGDRSRFNTPGWADQMDEWGEKAKGTFIGIGEAMEELLGLTEDVGGQIGFLLGENLAGNIDNARLLVQQLGLSFEDMVTALVEAGRSGEMSWLQVESAIAGAQEAFKPGLEAIGDIKGAWDSIYNSGGRGIAALKGVRDAAVEAMEAGAQSIEDMGARMIAQGVDPTMVQAFLDSIHSRGIRTLEELAAASDRTAGSIIAGLAAGNEPIREAWEEMGQQLEDLTEKLTNLPSEKDIVINVKTNIDEAGRKIIEGDYGDADTAKSRVTVQPQVAEARIGPDLSDSGNVGVRNARMAKTTNSHNTSFQINVDARGNDANGIESKVRRAIVDMEPYLTGKAEQRVQDSIRRGGGSARQYGG